MKKLIKYLAVLTVALCVLGIQFGSITAAHADTNADLSLNVNVNFANTAVEVTICNQGPSDVTQFVLDLDLVGYAISDVRVVPYGDYPVDTNNGGDIGTFDLETMTWNGYLEFEPTTEDNHYRCIYLGFIGHTTGAVGDVATIDGTIVSSVLSDTSVNADPDTSNDSASEDPFTAALDPDIAVDTRLATTGEITPTTDVAYEVTVSNVGEGAYHHAGFTLLAFIIPDSATFVSVTDADDTDALSLSDLNPDPDEEQICMSPGRIEDIASGMNMTALATYSGQVVVCFLESSTDLPTGTSYKFNFNITAGDDMAAGTAEVVGLFEGNDPDTLAVQLLLIQETDVFEEELNNLIHLSYDPEALQVNIDRCPGQGETTSDGTGCFRLTFNKKIYGGSFDASDIDLGGVGTVSSIDNVDDFTYDVHIAGITPGATLTFLLNLNGIVDYSAQQNSTQVLGINTIRYAVDTPADTSGSASGSTSANGTLAATGIHKPDYTTPMLFIALGSLLFALSRRRKVASVVAE